FQKTISVYVDCYVTIRKPFFDCFKTKSAAFKAGVVQTGNKTKNTSKYFFVVFSAFLSFFQSVNAVVTSSIVVKVGVVKLFLTINAPLFLVFCVRWLESWGGWFLHSRVTVCCIAISFFKRSFWSLKISSSICRTWLIRLEMVWCSGFNI